MPAAPLKPLARPHRRSTFLLLLVLFALSIPVLYLYATGYRINLKGETSFISTGGMFISAERTGSEIYIDNELVRETRVFRRAFYAQNIDPGTHRVHVQREGSHTWVKELPVCPHLVTEAQAFNLPLVPLARAITRYTTSDDVPVISKTYTLKASTTQEFFLATTAATSTFRASTEYTSRLEAFKTPVATSTASSRGELGQFFTTRATSTATTTKESNGVRLFQDGEDVYAAWVGPRESMPYYYCAEPFAPWASSTDPIAEKPAIGDDVALALYAADEEAAELLKRAQEVAPEQECKPSIRLDRKWQKVSYFDFFPGTTDIVILALEHGIYAVEVDDRAWQNVQPIMEGEKLSFRVENGLIYVYDGAVIYEMILE